MFTQGGTLKDIDRASSLVAEELEVLENDFKEVFTL
jgi:hypothetical protein